MNLKLWEVSISEFNCSLSSSNILTHPIALHLFPNVIMDYSREWCPKWYLINNHWIKDIIKAANYLKMFPWPRLETISKSKKSVIKSPMTSISQLINVLFLYSFTHYFICHLSWIIIYKQAYPNLSYVNKIFITVDINSKPYLKYTFYDCKKPSPSILPTFW